MHPGGGVYTTDTSRHYTSGLPLAPGPWPPALTAVGKHLPAPHHKQPLPTHLGGTHPAPWVATQPLLTTLHCPLRWCHWPAGQPCRLQWNRLLDRSPYRLASKKRNWLPAKLCKSPNPTFQAISSVQPEGVAVWCWVLPGAPCNHRHKAGSIRLQPKCRHVFLLYPGSCPHWGRAGASVVRRPRNPTIRGPRPQETPYVLSRRLEGRAGAVNLCLQLHPRVPHGCCPALRLVLVQKTLSKWSVHISLICLFT